MTQIQPIIRVTQIQSNSDCEIRDSDSTHHQSDSDSTHQIVTLVTQIQSDSDSEWLRFNQILIVELVTQIQIV